MALLYQNLAIGYEEIDCFEEALNWCDRAIAFDLRCRRGIMIGTMLEQKAYTENRISGDRTDNKWKYKQAYQLLKLMNKRVVMTGLQKLYRTWYGEEVDI